MFFYNIPLCQRVLLLSLFLFVLNLLTVDWLGWLYYLIAKCEFALIMYNKILSLNIRYNRVSF